MEIKNMNIKKIMAAALLGAFAIGSTATVWSANPSFAAAGPMYNDECGGNWEGCRGEGRGYGRGDGAGCYDQQGPGANGHRHGGPGHRGEGAARREWKQHKFDRKVAAEKMAKTFGLDAKEIKEAFDAKRDFRDVMHAAVVAKASNQPFALVIRRKTAENTWRDVEAAMRVSPEMMKEVRTDVMTGWMAEKLTMDKKEVKNLLNDGYQPKDIYMASVISKLSNTNVKSLLKEKKTNNTWKDVAKAHNVDEKAFRDEMRKAWNHDNNFHRKGQKGEVHRPMPLPAKAE
ncbi:MAG: hypothetical protein Q4D07_05205 [Selenomonadaceae bacterium]|nr:hypothetical protein [Selenomonadaceae bacterium]